MLFVVPCALCSLCFTVAKGDTCSLQLLCSSRGCMGTGHFTNYDMMLSLCRLAALRFGGQQQTGGWDSSVAELPWGIRDESTEPTADPG